MRVDLIIFDCDGVIADSEILSAEVLIDQLAGLGIALTLDDVRRDFLGRSFPTVAAHIRDRLARVLPEDFEARYRARLLDRFATDLAPTLGIVELLAALDRPVCVATSSSPPRVARTLEVLGLSTRFGPHVFTASQVAQGKPAPDLFLFAAAQMGAEPSHALVIEDSAPGLAAARAAGMRVLHYAGGAHLAGQPAPEGHDSFADWRDFPALLARIEGVPG
ncbi:HAD family hydrolase [Paracoccus liaowanqingii]|uniref:HAD family hydrolase n=1 Tax=Paracoccus liaowanqingii TaxID=2560053 RepID=A0A4Z1CQ25_9RHOB|nr:HAD-IA family hydrolase [Paracoccus liaowanqingii]QDA35999.1 HAD-IA family hydrolase [Paracoccus liaowanqingii]TGN67107.1 HAD family hydrolase [Paracoccus liaowanqingii]